MTCWPKSLPISWRIPVPDRQTFRIFVNNRGMDNGNPLYSSYTDIVASHAGEAEVKATRRFGPFIYGGEVAGIVAIEWPVVKQSSKDWIKKHVG